jgi:IclR family mhp operon transcriptional activator
MIQELCDCVRDEDRIAAAAGAVLTRLQRSIVWPTSLGVFDGGTMVIKLTTRSSSPLVFDRAHVGERVPVLGTAMGTAYLAFASASVRRTVIAVLSKSDDPQCRIAKQPDRLRKILRTTVERGYAVRKGGTVANTASIAVPLLRNGHAAASIVISFLSSAMPVDDAVTKFLAPLQDSAREIARRIGRVETDQRRAERATRKGASPGHVPNTSL